MTDDDDESDAGLDAMYKVEDVFTSEGYTVSKAFRRFRLQRFTV